MTDDIFDVKNTEDLPEQLQKAVTKEFDNNIIELFKIAERPLHINEVTVAYYRKYGIEKTKRQITIKLCNMSRQINPKIIKYNKKGYYRLVDFKRWKGKTK
jgi:hypothetical protein